MTSNTGKTIDLDAAFTTNNSAGTYPTAPPPYQPSVPTFIAPASAPPPIYQTVDSAPANPLEDKQAKVRELCARYHINPLFESALWSLNEYHIIFLCDDSGSMNSPAGAGKTRWQELKEVVGEVFDISLIFDPVGMDVYFLNRQSYLNVRNRDIIDGMFLAPPSGGTPLLTKLTEINQYYSSGNHPVRKLVIVATDGEPSDDRAPYNQFKSVLGAMVRNNMRIGFLACTDQDDQVEYLNDIDRQYSEIDVNDDYYTEFRQIQRTQGTGFLFSYGDYVVKAIAGSIDNRLDGLDEVRIQIDTTDRHSHHHRTNLSHCAIL
jgi:hypothetical protein